MALGHAGDDAGIAEHYLTIERRAKTTCQAERIAVIGRIHQIRRTEAGCDRLANDIRQLICIGVAQLDQTVLVEIIVRAGGHRG